MSASDPRARQALANVAYLEWYALSLEVCRTHGIDPATLEHHTHRGAARAAAGLRRYIQIKSRPRRMA